MPRPGLSFVTLPGRRLVTLAADEAGRWPDRWCAASSQDHGDDVSRRTGPAASVGGRAGLGAVGPGHARPGRGAVDGSPDDPGRPSGAHRMARPVLPRGAGLPDRNHRRGAGGQPPPPPPGGLAAAGLRPLADRQRGDHLLCGLRAGGPARCPPRRPHAVARYYPATGAAALALLSLVLLLTPTGSLPSARWRWWAVITAATPLALVLVVPVVPGRLDPQLLLASSPFSDRALGGGPHGVGGA